MARYKQIEIVRRESSVDVPDNDVMTLTEVMALLKLSKQSVGTYKNSGALGPVLIDPDEPNPQKAFRLRRSAVMAFAARRRKGLASFVPLA